MRNLLVVGLMAVSVIPAAAFANTSTCGGAFGYQPSGSTLVEAESGFQTELQIFLNDCLVQQKLPQEEGNYHIDSFTEGAGTQTLVYDVEAFADPQRPTHSTCTLVKTVTLLPIKFSPGQVAPDTLPSKTEVTLSCTKPICTKDDSYLCPAN